MATSPPDIPPPIPSPAAPGTNGSNEKLDTGEFAKLQVEAKKEDKKRSPASHWDLVKSTVAIIGTLAGIVLGFVAFGDRVVARSEAKTVELVKSQKDTFIQHIVDSKVVHDELKDVLKDVRVEQKETRSDVKALYRAMPGRRVQARLENDVEEPSEHDVHSLGIAEPTRMLTPMPRPSPSDGGR